MAFQSFDPKKKERKSGVGKVKGKIQ